MSGRRADSAPLRLVTPEVDRLVSDQARHDELAHLAAAAARGEPGAVRTFLVMVLPHAFKVVRRVLGARHPEVEDTVQESASNILKALPRYRGDASVLHFVCRVAVLTAMNVRRRHSAHKRTFLRDEEASIDAVPSLRGAPDAELVAREARRRCESCSIRCPSSKPRCSPCTACSATRSPRSRPRRASLRRPCEAGSGFRSKRCEIARFTTRGCSTS